MAADVARLEGTGLMSEQDTRPPGGGKKIMGLPRNAVIIGGVTLVLAVAYFLYKRRQSGTSSSSTDTSGTDYSGEISTLQTEYGDLASELAAMQGNGAGSSGSAGGGTPVIVGNGPTGTTGTTDTTGTTPGDGSTSQAKGKAPAPKPKPKPGPRPKGPAETDAHADHMAHLAHERHIARRRTGP